MTKKFGIRTRPWKLGLGAEIHRGSVSFRVWAPSCRNVSVVIEGTKRESRLKREDRGYFSATVPSVPVGSLYRYRLNGSDLFPDPCSRSQPQGPHGPSQVIDPDEFRWTDLDWTGPAITGQVMYELHVGTFTPQGTLDAALNELDELQDLGITVIELMPVAEFPGRFNWGYDGVDLFAPSHVYGGPSALKRFVDAAHRLGISVILDVVYNHLGPDGNYLSQFSKQYFTQRYRTDWGEAINFDGPQSREVREFFIRNACYWIREYHLDGLRLDATQNIYDSGHTHFLAELSRHARIVAAPRRILLIAENEPQDARCLTSLKEGGFGLDAVWTDDFHHSAHVAATGFREAYFVDYRGDAQELLSATKRTYLFQGQYYLWQKKRRGDPVTDQPAQAYVFYIQNHDQVANHLYGERFHATTAPGIFRAITALLLLSPETPLLFMGQEFAASSPFQFFADHNNELASLVHKGRKKYLAQFPSYATPTAQTRVADPHDPATFVRSKLKFSERRSNQGIYRLHKDLLRLRKTDVVISEQNRNKIDGAVFSTEAFALRFFGKTEDRLLIVNLGKDLEYQPSPEPLLAPPAGRIWELLWSSNDPEYGGPGIVNPATEQGWKFSAMSATLLASIPTKETRRAG